MNKLKLGIDIGSTTLKTVVMDSSTKEILFHKYIRHNADINHSCLSTVPHFPLRKSGVFTRNAVTISHRWA